MRNIWERDAASDLKTGALLVIRAGTILAVTQQQIASAAALPAHIIALVGERVLRGLDRVVCLTGR